MKARYQINHEQPAFQCAVLEREAATRLKAQAFSEFQIGGEERCSPAGKLLLEGAAPLRVFGLQRFLFGEAYTVGWVADQ